MTAPIPVTAPRTIPVTVIGGYLGAGKTTLVNHLLRHANGLRIAVAVNEFGALPIDQDLIVGAEGNILTLAGGCICCTFGSDLVAGLMDLTTRADSIDHILIEASGVALPGAIAQSVSLVVGLTLDCIVVVADAETVRARASDLYLGDTIVRQLADADIVLLNKADLAPALGAVTSWLPSITPAARIVATNHGRIASEVVFGIGSLFDPAASRAPHNAQGLSAATFAVTWPVDAQALAEALASSSLGLVRAKGFVFDAVEGPALIQIVGRRHAVTTIAATEHPSRLVCIAHGRQIDHGTIHELIRRNTSIV
jgi:G3E family GTPase